MKKMNQINLSRKLSDEDLLKLKGGIYSIICIYYIQQNRLIIL